jgi:hypothetical protein
MKTADPSCRPRTQGCLEMQPVMTRYVCYAVTSAGDDHFSGLERSIVRGSKPSVCGQASERGIGKIALN